ncbi:MAG: hypothetical protein R3E95_19285 [Thiolinea sp.]
MAMPIGGEYRLHGYRPDTGNVFAEETGVNMTLLRKRSLTLTGKSPERFYADWQTTGVNGQQAA